MNKPELELPENKLHLNSKPNSIESVRKLINISDDYLKQGQFDQALKRLNQGASLNPDFDEIYQARAAVYQQKGEYQKALPDLNLLIELEPDKPTTYIQRAEIYRLLNEPHKALDDLSQAIKLDGYNPLALGRRGIIYHKLNQFNKALLDFNQALKLNPNNAWLYGIRAEAYRSLRKFPKALRDYNRVLELNPSATWVYERRSLPNLWVGNIDAAQADFKKAWEANPANLMNGWMVEWTGMCQENFSFSHKVKERLKSLANSDPKDYVAYLCRASLYWELQVALKESYHQAEIACNLMPDKPEAYFWKGMAAAGLNENEEASDLLQKALNLGMPPALFGPIGWLKKVNPVFYEDYGSALLKKNGLEDTLRAGSIAASGLAGEAQAQARNGQVQLFPEAIESLPTKSLSKSPVAKSIGNGFGAKTPKSKLFVFTLIGGCLLITLLLVFILMNYDTPVFTQLNTQSQALAETKPNATITPGVQSLPIEDKNHVSATAAGQSVSVTTSQPGATFAEPSSPAGLTSDAGETIPVTTLQAGPAQTDSSGTEPAASPPGSVGTPETPTTGITIGTGRQLPSLIPGVQKENPTVGVALPTTAPNRTTVGPAPNIPTIIQPANPAAPNNTSTPGPQIQTPTQPDTVLPPKSNPIPPTTGGSNTPIPGAANTPVPAATPVPPNTVAPTAIPVPTVAPAPTVAPVPTDTPVPTVAPAPTVAPVPTDTPVPTVKPVPTNTPVPTIKPVPTDTPVPTAIPPTNTAAPTATPQGPPTPRPKPTKKH